MHLMLSRMIQRAKELKTRRERERRELAEQKRLQQYRYYVAPSKC